MSTPPNRYPTLHVQVRADEVDFASAALFEVGATGVEERDDATLLAGPGDGWVLLIASFEDHATAEGAGRALAVSMPDRPSRLDDVVGDAWRDAWKEHYRPLALTETVTVVPPWIEYAPTGPRERVLMLEPGRAFGTGLHATTALVAQMLQARAPRLAGSDVLDAGTGSGILGLTALLLGARRVVAFDLDPDVIEVVLENAARNRLKGRIEVFCGTIDDVRGRFGIVVANIETRVLQTMSAGLSRSVAAGGELLVSGVLASEERDLVATLTRGSAGLRHVETQRSADHERSLASPDGPPGAAEADRWVAIALSAAP
jgi:ribosomal protein L11 methyltransferase